MKDYWFIVWKITCLENPTEPTYIVDDGGDPSFECPFGDGNFNHIHEREAYGHKMERLGYVKIDDIVPFLTKVKPKEWG